MTKIEAKALVRPVLERIFKKMPRYGIVGEFGPYRSPVVNTIEEARTWIKENHRDFYDTDVNMMPLIRIGWFVG